MKTSAVVVRRQVLPQLPAVVQEGEQSVHPTEHLNDGFVVPLPPLVFLLPTPGPRLPPVPVTHPPSVPLVLTGSYPRSFVPGLLLPSTGTDCTPTSTSPARAPSGTTVMSPGRRPSPLRVRGRGGCDAG